MTGDVVEKVTVYLWRLILIMNRGLNILICKNALTAAPSNAITFSGRHPSRRVIRITSKLVLYRLI